MHIRMTVKYTPESYHSRGFEVELTPEDIGLQQPTSINEYDECLKALQYQGAKAIHFFLLKEGYEDKDQVVTSIRAYK